MYMYTQKCPALLVMCPFTLKIMRFPTANHR